jgi:hypothetical protein
MKGDTPLKISWTFQGYGSSLNTQKGVEISKTSSKSSLLSIESLSAENSGNYTVIFFKIFHLHGKPVVSARIGFINGIFNRQCTAKNEAGVANYTTSLTVDG